MLGADFTAIRKAVREFKAVEHRLEFVREIRGVDFYNNSKATSVDATLKSLEAFDGGVHLILGGKDKGAPYTPLLPLIKERVREILLIGAASPVIAEQLAGSTELVDAGDLATAVREAFARRAPAKPCCWPRLVRASISSRITRNAAACLKSWSLAWPKMPRRAA